MLLFLEAIRNRQLVSLKNDDIIMQMVSQQANDLASQNSGLATAIDSNNARLHQRIDILTQLLADHHTHVMSKLGATSDSERYKITRTRPLKFDILSLLPSKPTINVLDIGAMTFGYRSELYGPLQEAGICRVVGFEPIEKACEELTQMYPNDCFLPNCAGNGKRGRLHVTECAMTSSLYEPAQEVLEQFENLSSLMKVAHVEEVDTVRIDDVLDRFPGPIDLIKNDTQGAELDIFAGAVTCLQSALVIHCEVEFVPLYRNQPLFSDVDGFLRQQGFGFHRFNDISARLRSSFPYELVYQTPGTQMLWGDAVYVRSLLALQELAPEQLLKLAIITHMLYQSYDLSLAALQSYDSLCGTEIGSIYRERLLESAAMNEGALLP